MSTDKATDTPQQAPAVGAPLDRGVRPQCWAFAMDFLGDPEAPEVEAYVAGLEAEVKRLHAALYEINCLHPDKDSDEGFNEWGEAECFNKAQDLARAALVDLGA